MKHANPRWQDMVDWQPKQRSYRCACGCNAVVVWQGIGRKPKYIEGHRQRVYWRQKHQSTD